MPRFVYTAKDKDGKTVNGVVEEVDMDTSVSALQEKGLMVLTIKEEAKKEQKAAGKRLKLKSGLSTDDLMLFSRQMSTLLNAGVTLLKSLTIMTRQVTSKPLHNAVKQMRKDVEEGMALHESVSKHPKVFSSIWPNLIQTGETSGQLGPIFQQLTGYLETTGMIQKRIKSALVYPIILLVVCVAAILIFTLKIIPMFGEIYQGFDIEMPALTQMVLRFSVLMRRYFLIILGGIIGTVFLLRSYVSTKKGRIQFDTLKMKLPIFGPMIEGIIIERFAHGLGTLIKSGIPILFGLDIVSKVVGNKVVELALDDVKQQVRDGKPMSEPLEASGVFPVVVTQMISVGEETGKLSDMLDRIAVYYQEQMTAFVDKLTAAFEPMLLIFMGGTVGVLVIAMYLPIFKIAQAAM